MMECFCVSFYFQPKYWSDNRGHLGLHECNDHAGLCQCESPLFPQRRLFRFWIN